MSWHGVVGAHTAAVAGNDTILTPWPTLYFDNRQSTLPTEPPGRMRVVSLEDVYRFEPRDATLSEVQRHHVLGIQANIWTEHIQTEERVQWMALPRAAALAEVAWSAPERRRWPDFLERLGPMVARYRAFGLNYADSALASAAQNSRSAGDAVSRANPAQAALRRDSHHLELCSDGIGLLLEPAGRGEHSSGAAGTPLAVDIMNPCWIDRGVDLSAGPRVLAAVAPLPFNYEIGADAAKIRVGDARTAEGELEIHVDGCDTPARVLLPLAPAASARGVTTLPAQRLPALAGRHDLCLRFARPRLDPLWAIDWVEVGE
jgi:hexosaminidase